MKAVFVFPKPQPQFLVPGQITSCFGQREGMVGGEPSAKKIQFARHRRCRSASAILLPQWTRRYRSQRTMGKARAKKPSDGSVVLKGHTAPVHCVAMTPDGSRAISGSGDGTLRVWDLASAKCLAILEGHTGPVRDVALAADGIRAISGSTDDTLRVWDIPSETFVLLRKSRSKEVTAVAMTPDGACAISASEGGTLRAWDLRSRRVFRGDCSP